jgi:hypothetical protein
MQFSSVPPRQSTRNPSRIRGRPSQRREPTSTSSAIRLTAENLAAIAKDFDFDVPDAVKQFLDALPQGGAPLSLLTDEVRAWIIGQGQTDRYRVVAGGI